MPPWAQIGTVNWRTNCCTRTKVVTSPTRPAPSCPLAITALAPHDCANPASLKLIASTRVTQPADVAAIKCPTLLVTGEEDGVAPPAAVRAIGEKIAGSRVEVLPKCGHWTPLECADECIDLLRGFYAGQT